MATSNPGRVSPLSDQLPIQSSDPAYVTPVSHGATGDGSAANADAPGRASDDGSSIDHVQDKAAIAPKPSKRQRTKAHFKRFWWAYLIGSIILLAILLPILFKVIIPAIVQNIVSGQSLPVKSGQLRAVSPTQLNFTLVTELDTPLPATIDELPLDLYRTDDGDIPSFVTLTLPKIKVDGKTESQIVNQTVNIDDLPELITWFNTIFDNSSTEVYVKAKPKVHLGALSYDPSLKKKLSIPSLNYLNGFGVTSMEFTLPPDERGYNMKGVLDLPNSGTLDLYLGNVSFDMYAGDTKLGLVNLYELDMKSGMNHPNFDGEFYFDQLVPNLGAILQSQGDGLTRGVLTLHATGHKTTINGERIAYVEEVLNHKKIPFEIPIITFAADLLSAFVDTDNQSLFGIVGETFGNTTLIDQLRENFDGFKPTGGGDGSQNKSASRKRSPARSSLFYNMLRLGLASSHK
jgi:hypothetical protein